MQQRLLLVLTLGCVSALAQPSKKEDTWERKKQCYEYAKQAVQRDYQPPQKDSHVGWTAHYSQKYGHCYMKTEIFYLKADASGALSPDFSITSLSDVLENKVLVVMTSRGTEAIGPDSTKVSIADAEAYIKDHMEN